jgi:hypothetical protein
MAVVLALLLAAALTTLAAPSPPIPTTQVISSVGSQLWSTAFDPTRLEVWITNHNPSNATVSVRNIVDGSAAPANGKIVGGGANGIAYDGAGYMWIANDFSQNVVKVRTSDGAIVQTISGVGSNPYAVAFDGANMWVSRSGSTLMKRYRASDGASVGDVAAWTSATHLVFDGTRMWVSLPFNDAVYVYDTNGVQVATLNLPRPQGMAFDGANMWIASYTDAAIYTFNASTFQPAGSPVYVGGGPYGLAYTGGFVWVTNILTDNAQIIDAGRRTVVASNVSTGGTDPRSVIVTFDKLWFANQTGGNLMSYYLGDGDYDNLTTVWEIVLGLNYDASDSDFDGVPDGSEDSDGDGLSNYAELYITNTYPSLADTDGDGLSDGAEVNTYATNPTATDTDGDGLSDGAEVNTHTTNPLAADTDGDGLTDGAEVNTHTTNPKLADTDGDGLTDGAEVNIHTTNPKLADTDGDGLSDGAEVNTYTTNPKVADTDGDGLSDGAEVNTYTTNPKVADTDGDGLTDGAEVNTHGTNPKMADTDGDGLTDGAEVNTHSTNPKMTDTDGDGLADGVEINAYQTNPTQFDTDGDGLNDGLEVNLYNTNPKVADTDGDGLSDGEEVNTYTTNPKLADTDGDGLGDGVEITVYGTNPKSTDSDNDGVPDGDEDPDGDGLSILDEVNTHGTNPLSADTDGDGLMDGIEVQAGLNPLAADSDGDGTHDAAEDLDGDGLTNLQEQASGTDLNQADTDGDGLSDHAEVVVYGTNPLNIDTDGDGYFDNEEIELGSDPLDAGSVPPNYGLSGAITSPGDGRVITSATYVISGTASGYHLAAVRLSLDGATWHTAAGTANWSYVWTVPGLDAKSVIINVRLRNDRGDETALTPVTVSVDRVAPAMTLDDPVVGQIIRTHVYSLTGSVADGSGLASVEVSTDDGATWQAATVGSSVWSYAWHIPSQNGVSHLLQGRATDAGGNVRLLAPAPITVFVDNVAPQLVFTSLSSTQTITRNTLLVAGYSTGALTTTIDYGQGWVTVPSLFTETITLTNGTHVITGAAVDAAGNATVISSTVTVDPDFGLSKVYLPLVLRAFDPDADPYEPNDTYTEARPVQVEETQRHQITRPGDVDWMRVDVTPGIYVFTTRNVSSVPNNRLDTVMRLYASNGTTQLAYNDDCAGVGIDSCINWEVTTNTTLYLKVNNYFSGYGGREYLYDLSVIRQ